jgi:hypothetical protein
MRLKIVEVLQQHKKIFAARGEICRAGSRLRSSALEVGNCLRVSPICPDRGLR